jgi:co-chaperonin GroES (HSP10)
MVMMNNSGLHPCGDRVVIKPEVVEKTSSGGIILMDDSVNRDAMAQVIGTLVAVGPDAWSDYSEPFAKVGDRVLFAKYGGLQNIGVDGELYRISNDTDVTARVDDDFTGETPVAREPLRRAV